jgi:hypothetical protein
MAKVLLHSVALEDPRISQWMQGAYRLFTESAGIDPFGVHELTHDPEKADIIVFAELGSQGIFEERVRRHPLVKRYRDKCFLFDPGDFALPFLPGLYASLRQRYADPSRTRTGYYLRIDENPYVDFTPLRNDAQYLACFVGSIDNDPVRAELGRLRSEEFLIEDTSQFALKLLYGGPEEDRHRFWRHYAESMASAPFAICPRGRGPGSVRLFEAMRMGRVPVILADEWVYPERVDWQACSVTVAENDVAKLPELLRQHRARAAEMGLCARQEWERYYAPPVRFHWLAEDCLALLAARKGSERVAGLLVWRHLLNFGTFRRYLNSKKTIYRQSGKIML